MSLIAPRHTNGFIPHILRARWFLMVGLMAAWSIYVAASYEDALRYETSSAAVVSAEVVSHTNTERLAYHMKELRPSAQLERAAKLKADDMVSRGYFAHISPTGAGAWTFLADVGYQYEYAGENLAVNFGSADEVVRAWMNSPTHRANVLNESFNEIGIAAAEGVYKGRQATFVVQMFGRTIGGVLSPDVIPLADAGAQDQQSWLTRIGSEAGQAGAQVAAVVGDPRTVAGLPMLIIVVLVLIALMSYPAMRKTHRIGAALSGFGLIAFSMLLLAISQYILMPVIL